MAKTGQTGQGVRPGSRGQPAYSDEKAGKSVLSYRPGISANQGLRMAKAAWESSWKSSPIDSDYQAAKAKEK